LSFRKTYEKIKLSPRRDLSHHIPGGCYVTVKRNPPIELGRHFDFSTSEAHWIERWGDTPHLDAANFSLPQPDPQPWFLPMPPPNITGQLHLGHALFLTLQDIRTRGEIIQGRDALWLPGTDHAGLATHAKIIETMAQQEQDPSNETDYLATGWAWKDRYHARITHQMRRMGAACDWTQERFTLDDAYLASAREAFRRLIAGGNLSHRDRQWYLAMEDLAAPLIEAIEDGTILITPAGSKNELLGMLRHIEPWCLSRQIPWGMKMPLATNGDLWRYQDGPSTDGWEDTTDTLDTWFLSALWPFASLGWPHQTPQFERYYPGAWMETGDDILFFWCARMLMLGKNLTGEWPFREIFLHGIIRDSKGRKMSKGLGNGIDPLDCIASKGTDALRWMLATQAEPGLDMKFNPATLNIESRFINKIWQAARFLAQYPPIDIGERGETSEERGMEDLTKEWKIDLQSNAFPRLARKLQKSFTEEFCGSWIERSKNSLSDGDEQLQALGYRIFKRYLTLLHPFLPFLTSELQERLKLIPGANSTQAELIDLDPSTKGNGRGTINSPKRIYDDERGSGYATGNGTFG
jgi:valyl-tRNA synthetase